MGPFNYYDKSIVFRLETQIHSFRPQKVDINADLQFLQQRGNPVSAQNVTTPPHKKWGGVSK